MGERIVACVVIAVLPIVVWAFLSKTRVLPALTIPSPGEVAVGMLQEVQSGRLWRDVIASLFRVTAGFLLAAILALPTGLWLGHSIRGRIALLPFINFFRCTSPLAWIPFAILWFGIGDLPVVFLIFMASFFPIVLAISAAVANIPSSYFRVAEDYGLVGLTELAEVTLPAVAPQLITTLRVTAGLAWMVVVAAEMVAGRDGLGFAIWDARNGLRMDLLVLYMGTIGSIGVGLDGMLRAMSRIPSVRWGYER